VAHNSAKNSAKPLLETWSWTERSLASIFLYRWPGILDPIQKLSDFVPRAILQ
jgi:hypothetical protein